MLRRFKSGFGYAFAGLWIAWARGINFRVQIICTVLVLALGWLLKISSLEFVAVLFAITIVLAAETFNTALEELCDKFQPSHDPHIARIKDLAAAAVLITSIGAGSIGIIIFVPYLWNSLG